MLERSRVKRLFVTVVAVGMVVSMMAPFAWAGAPPADGTHASSLPDGDEVPTNDPRTDYGAESVVSTDLADEVNETDGDTVEVVVRFEEASLPASADAETTVEGLREESDRAQADLTEFVRATDGAEVRQQFWVTNAVVVEIDPDRVSLETLAERDGVTAIHPNFEVTLPDPSNATATDGDTEVTYGLDQINATEVWDAYDTKGDDATVAVLDTGVDPSHPDIDIDPENFAAFDGDGERVDADPHDTGWHGTHVSGTVVGSDDPAGDVPAFGVAPEAELMHGLVLPEGQGTFAQIVGGIEWAVDEEAHVVSMSLGADGYYEQFVDPIRNAEAAGTVVVSSSGNDGQGTSGSPANLYDGVAVGASDEAYDVTDFSSGEVIDTDAAWGADAPDDWPDEYVVPDVVAPGDAVASAVPEGTIPGEPDEIYGSASGTSMAAPHVSGVVALGIAAGGGPDPETVDQALVDGAWKPGDEPDDPDDRYGHGLTDATVTTDLLAVDSGVSGVVTDAADDPIADATVTVSETGLTDTTDADGHYEVTTRSGNYTLTTEAFGYADDDVEVTVPDEETTVERNVTLDPAVDAEVVADQPDAVEGGETVTTTLSVAHLETLTVDVHDGFDGDDATLVVDGTERDFGEAIEFANHTGETTVSVETADGSAGELSLEHVLAGPGDDVVVDTGPTVVYPEAVPIAVVTNEEDAFGDDVAARLDGQLSVEYEIDHVVGLDTATDMADEYESFVVQNVTTDRAAVSEFVAATEGSDAGVVYLSQYGPVGNAVEQLSSATGDPTHHGEQAQMVHGDLALYELMDEHPIVDDVGEPGEMVVLHDAGFNDWFEDLVRGETIANPAYETCGFVGCSNVTHPHPGLAADDLRGTVLATTMASIPPAGADEYTDDADTILANAVEWSARDRPVSIADPQPERVDAGTDVTVTLDADDVEKLKVSVADESTVDPDRLSLEIDGSVNAFGEFRAFEPPRDDEITVHVDADDGTVGLLAFDLTVVDADGDEATGTSGPTAMYTPPLSVPDDVDGLQGAVDLAVAGEEIVVDDGTYEPVTVHDAANHGLTLTAAEDADPMIETYDERGSEFRQSGIRIETDDVTVDGLAINVTSDWDEGIEVVESDDATIRNVHVDGGQVGVELGAAFTYSNDAHVENVTIEDAETGVLAYLSDDARIEDVHVSGAAEDGIRSQYSTDATITDVHVTDSESGVFLDAWNDDTTVTNATITDSGTGVTATALGPATVTDVAVTDADVGLRVAEEMWPHEGDGDLTLEANHLDAETGVFVEADVESHEASLTRNHLANATAGVEKAGDGAFDARLNYFGDGGPGLDGTAGEVHAQPFLTVPPGDLEAAPEATTAIGVDVRLEAGGIYAVGVPGPTEGTVGEAFGDFEGAIYGYDADADAWTLRDADDPLSALDALAVVAEEDTTATFTFETDTPSAPGAAHLDEGWNFVAAPTAGVAADGFDPGSASPTLITRLHAQPSGTLTSPDTFTSMYEIEDAPTTNPFAGYFVFVDEAGQQPSHLASNPTAADLYDAFDVEAPTDATGAAVDAETTVHAVALDAAAAANATTDDPVAVEAAAANAASTAALQLGVDDDAVVDAAVTAALDELELDPAVDANDERAAVDAAITDDTPRLVGASIGVRAT